jgi:uncharacterized protein YjbJ (UPF0337 family)
MEATQDILRGRWLELKRQVGQKWSKLTDEDLFRMSGNAEELAGALQLRYGYAKGQAVIQIKDWLSSLDKSVAN